MRVGLAIALALSLASNVWLLATRRAATPAARHGDRPAAATTTSVTATVGAPAPSPSVGATAVLPAGATAGPSCDARVAQLAKALAEAEAARDAHLPLPARFERARPDATVEARVRADIDRLVKAQHTLECRGDICRLTTLVGGAEDDPMEALQTDEALRRKIGGMSFHAGAPVKDPVSGRSFQERETYFEVEPERDDGMALVDRIVARFREVGLPACARRFPEARGELQTRLSLDASGRFEVRAAGSLAMTPPGDCLEAALRDAARAVPMPATLSPATRFGRFTLPPE